jgi:hypothetical protein
VGHSFILTAGMLLGQTSDVQVIQQPQRPCNCQQPSTTTVQRQTWTYANGTQTSTWSSSSSGWTEDKSVLQRIGDRFNQVLGRRPAASGHTLPQEQFQSGANIGPWVQVPSQGQVITTPGAVQVIEPKKLANRVVVGPSGDVTMETAEPPMIQNVVKPASFDPVKKGAPKSGEANSGEAKGGEPVLIPLPEPASLPPAPVPVAQPVEIKASLERPAAVSSSSTPAYPAQVGQPKGVARDLGQIQARFVQKIGHEEDWSWITGQLQIENGAYVVYYATPDTVDRFHGRLVLYPEIDMARFRAGDLVNVRGQVRTQANGGMLYVGQAVDLIER